MMKLLSFFLFAAFAVSCLASCARKDVTLSVVLTANDTVISGSAVTMASHLLIDDKPFVFVNTFERDTALDTRRPFNLSLYRGLTISYGSQTVNAVSHFLNPSCQPSLPGFPVFNGDSIDNPDGFKAIELKRATDRILALRGYFWGCNGSACNLGFVSILVLNNADQLLKAYVFGVDESMVDLSTAYFSDQQGQLVYHLKISGKDAHVAIGDQLEVLQAGQNTLLSFGLSCLPSKH